MKIKYIGGKQLKKDNVTHTGVVWRGHGDVQEVPDSAAVALLAYTDIWVKVDHKPELPEFKFSNNRSEAIAEAIGLLDPKNSEHYTKLDQPRVEVIEMLLGYDITTHERNEGFFLFKHPEGEKGAGELPPVPPDGEPIVRAEVGDDTPALPKPESMELEAKEDPGEQDSPGLSPEPEDLPELQE